MGAIKNKIMWEQDNEQDYICDEDFGLVYQQDTPNIGQSFVRKSLTNILQNLSKFFTRR
jgi:hypothetical protein